MDYGNFVDPIQLGRTLWPDVRFYDKQREVIYSVVEDAETFVPAGNMLGKDFVAAFITLWFFLTRSPCRVVTTSADYSQLESVLWGEIRRFIQTSAYPLDAANGGPLLINHLHLRKVHQFSPQERLRRQRERDRLRARNKGKSRAAEVGRIMPYSICGVSYCIGRTAAKGEGMLGHHVAETGDGIPRTLFVADEASGVEDTAYERADTWAKRKLVIGNCYPTDNNFFERGVEAGNLGAREDLVRGTW